MPQVLTVAIQAGGRSKRMGADKGLVVLDGQPLIERVVSRVVGVGDELLITTNDPEAYAYLGLRLVGDRQPGAGALHGLLTALEGARHEQVLIVGCDMPFVAPALLQHLVQHAGQAEVVVPYHEGEYEPLLAVYAKSCAAKIRANLAAGQRRMISFFPQVKLLTVDEPALRKLDPDGLSFFNVNTPEDLQQARRLLAEQTL